MTNSSIISKEHNLLNSITKSDKIKSGGKNECMHAMAVMLMILAPHSGHFLYRSVQN